MQGGFTKIVLSRDGGTTFYDAIPSELNQLQMLNRSFLLTINSPTVVYAQLLKAAASPSVSVYFD